MKAPHVSLRLASSDVASLARVPRPAWPMDKEPAAIKLVTEQMESRRRVSSGAV